jgi:hypothetical protein
MNAILSSRKRGVHALALALLVCAGAVGAAIAVGPSDESPPAAASIGLFERGQKPAERGLLPSSSAIPGREEFGADPTNARVVDTGENGPDVIAYPGRSGACVAVLFDNGGGGQGASYACKPYAEIQNGTWLVTLESDEPGGGTQYVGLLPDGYESVQLTTGGGTVSHRVVDNVFSFAHAGAPGRVTAADPDGMRKPLG